MDEPALVVVGCERRGRPLRWLPPLLALALLALLPSCGWRLSPSPGPLTEADYRYVTGTVELSGPLPVFTAYDGTNAIATHVDAGIFLPGTSTLKWGGPLEVPESLPYPPNAIGTLRINLSFAELGVAYGNYDLALYAEGPGDDFTGDLFGLYSPIMLQRGARLELTAPGQHFDGQDFQLNFSGPGPYGTLSGRLLLSGNPLILQLPALVLKPASPQPGVSAQTGLLWQLDAAAARHGRLDFTVPAVSYGSYELSYSGGSLRDRDDGLKVSGRELVLEAQHQALSGLDILVSNAWQSQRPFELGRISGTLTLPQVPAAGEAYVVSARRSDLEAGDPQWSYNYNLEAQWVLLAKDFNAQRQADFQLGWLTDGAYELQVYRLAASLAQEDTLLASNAVPQMLAAAQRELEGVSIEVQP